MDRPIIPIKTSAGQAELGSRERRVSQRHRTMLLLVDGRRTEVQVRSLSAQAGVPAACYEDLLQLGLISVSASNGALAPAQVLSAAIVVPTSSKPTAASPATSTLNPAPAPAPAPALSLASAPSPSPSPSPSPAPAPAPVSARTSGFAPLSAAAGSPPQLAPLTPATPTPMRRADLPLDLPAIRHANTSEAELGHSFGAKSAPPAALARGPGPAATAPPPPDPLASHRPAQAPSPARAPLVAEKKAPVAAPVPVAVQTRLSATPPPRPAAELPFLDQVITRSGESSSLFGDDSELPPSRTLSPESTFDDTGLGELSPATNWPVTEPHIDEPGDFLLERARDILLRAVRNEAPVAGSLTMFRLRRARNRAELEALLDEVAARIDKPPHSLAAVQTLRRVRNVLDGRDTSPAPL